MSRNLRDALKLHKSLDMRMCKLHNRDSGSAARRREMQDLLNLIETVPGQVALEVFARKAGMAQPAMRYELTVNAPLAQYFCQIVAQSMEAA